VCGVCTSAELLQRHRPHRSHLATAEPDNEFRWSQLTHCVSQLHVWLTQWPQESTESKVRGNYTDRRELGLAVQLRQQVQVVLGLLLIGRAHAHRATRSTRSEVCRSGLACRGYAPPCTGETGMAVAQPATAQSQRRLNGLRSDLRRRMCSHVKAAARCCSSRTTATTAHSERRPGGLVA
jgi:hypothetical protein